MFCHKCGNKALEGAAFCPNCGTKLIRDEAVGQEPQPSAPAVKPEPIAPAVIPAAPAPVPIEPAVIPVAAAPAPAVAPQSAEPAPQQMPGMYEGGAKKKKSKKLLFGLAGAALVVVIAIIIAIAIRSGDDLDLFQIAQNVSPMTDEGFDATYGDVFRWLMTDRSTRLEQQGDAANLTYSGKVTGGDYPVSIVLRVTGMGSNNTRVIPYAMTLNGTEVPNFSNPGGALTDLFWAHDNRRDYPTFMDFVRWDNENASGTFRRFLEDQRGGAVAASPSSGLIGRWESVSDDFIDFFNPLDTEFFPDGTVIAQGNLSDITGSWVDSGNGQLKVTDEDGNTYMFRYEISGDRLTLTDSSGDSSVFRMVGGTGQGPSGGNGSGSSSDDDPYNIVQTWLNNHPAMGASILFESYGGLYQEYYRVDLNDMYWISILVHRETGELFCLLTEDGPEPGPPVIEPLDDYYNRYWGDPEPGLITEDIALIIAQQFLDDHPLHKRTITGEVEYEPNDFPYGYDITGLYRIMLVADDGSGRSMWVNRITGEVFLSPDGNILLTGEEFYSQVYLTYQGELLFNGNPVIDFFEYTIDGIIDIIGPPLWYEDYDGGRYGYEGIIFVCNDSTGEILYIELDPGACEVDGVTLNKPRNRCLGILGVPANEGFIWDELGENVVGYYMQYGRSGYSFSLLFTDFDGAPFRVEVW